MPLPMLAALLVAVWGDGSGEYDAARARAGDGPEGLVRLALWCERHGLDDERARNLTLAVEQKPDDARARGLLGMVKLDGRWREATEAADGSIPEALARYNERRGTINPNRAEDHWQLALWCERHGLKPEARAHLAQVIRFEPSREAAWRRLGFLRHKGRWMTQEEINAAIVDTTARHEADKHWGPEFERLRMQIQKGGPAAAEAEAALAAVRAPLAVAKLWEIFVVRSRRVEDHARAVGVLAGIESREATLRLTRLAVSSPDQPVSSAAAEALLKRDPREVIETLIESFRVPLAFQVVPGQGGIVGQLQVEGQTFTLERFYVLQEDYNPVFRPVSLGRSGRTQLLMRGVPDYGAARAQARAALNRDVAMLTQFNAAILHSNERIDSLLQRLTGHREGRDALAKADSARADPALPEGLPGSLGVQMRQYREMLELTNRRNAAMSALTDSARRAPFAAPGARSPQDRTAPMLRLGSLNQQEDDVNVAYTAELLAIQQRGFVEARQADWEQAKQTPQREEVRGQAWRKWWANERGYSSDEPEPRPKRQVTQLRTYEVPVYLVMYSHSSCFAAGTPVHTRTGIRPIEELKVGDLVLGRDTATGGLEYQPVTAVYHRRPAPTFKVVIGGEALVVTGIHRFWKAGAGWVMARDLKPGDPIRTVDGARTVDSVQPDEVRPVYNLDVEHTRSYLVGRAGALVHDDHLPDPMSAPFDAVPELVAARAK